MSLQSISTNLPDNLNVVNMPTKCPLCRGKKWLLRLDDGKSKVECHRCGGVGKLHETGPQRQSKSKKLSDSLAPEDISAYAKGMPKINWYALRWVVLGEQQCFPFLHAVALKELERIAEKEEWTYQENAKFPRLRTLTTLTLIDLQAPAKLSTMEHRGAVMHMNPRTFERTWMARFIRLSVHVNKWYADGSDRIQREHGRVMREIRDEQETAA